MNTKTENTTEGGAVSNSYSTDLLEYYFIERSDMSGRDIMPTCYNKKEIANRAAERLNRKADCPLGGKWEDYRVVPLKGERIDGDRVLLNGRVYNLLEGLEPTVRERALAKLTAEERESLGF